jgi:hypothetical protein
MALSSIVCVPIFAVIRIMKGEGNLYDVSILNFILIFRTLASTLVLGGRGNKEQKMWINVEPRHILKEHRTLFVFQRIHTSMIPVLPPGRDLPNEEKYAEAQAMDTKL